MRLRQHVCTLFSPQGRRKDFFQGGPVGDFPKIFSRGGQKWWVKFGFYPSKLKKQPFFANNFKIQGGKGPPLLPPSDAHECRNYMLDAFSWEYLQMKRSRAWHIIRNKVRIRTRQVNRCWVAKHRKTFAPDARSQVRADVRAYKGVDAKSWKYRFTYA